MARPRTRYVCQTCGATQSGWMGRCPECGEWNTLVETVVEAPEQGAPATGRVLVRNKPQPLSEISVQPDEYLPVPMEELSRVLGGGIVPGSVTLVSGDPGIGKSTLLLQLAALLCVRGVRAREPVEDVNAVTEPAARATRAATGHELEHAVGSG